MANLTDSTNLIGTITLSKATGTKVTLDTDHKYLTKDIELTIDAPTTTATASGATVSYGEGWIAAGSTTVTDSNLVAGNIKKDVSIFGVTGTLENSLTITDVANTTGVTAQITADNVDTLITKNITTNGTYNASIDGADGYSSVTVNVSGDGDTTWETVYSGIVNVQDWGDPDIYYALVNGYFSTHDDFEYNKKYRITWINDQYECVATELSPSTGDGYAVGNAELFGGTTGNNEPFVMIRSYQSDNLTIGTTSSTGNKTLIIEKQVSSSGTEASGVMIAISGTVVGDGTNIIQIPCSFEPREIYIQSDLTSDESLRGIVTFVLIKDNHLSITVDSSTSNTTESAYRVGFITGYNESNSSEEPYASYSNGTLTINTVVNSGSVKFASDITYNYKLVGVTSPTQHNIYFEFSDNTNTTIPVYYNDSFVGTMITAYTPSTYGQKTVSLAQLDGVTWYEPADIPIGVELIDYNEATQGYYIGEDGDVHTNEWSYVSDYTEVDPSMTFSYTAYYWYYIGVYDANKNVVRTISTYDTATVDPQDGNICHGTLSGNALIGAKYVRISAPDLDERMSLIRTA